jgi:pyrroloquinoline-quinone synthase
VSLLIESVDNEIREKSLLKHKFYQMWSNGSLSVEDLRGYAKEYFEIVKAVPSLVGTVIQNMAPEFGCTDEITAKIWHNLEEENEHIDPWLSFAESIGVTRNELLQYECSYKGKDAVSAMINLAQSSFAAGVSTLYSYEKQLPEISAKKIEGLVNYYGINNEKALNYFKIHQKVDIVHAELWSSIMYSMPETLHRTILDAASKSLVCQNLILDGVCETYLSKSN